MRRAALTLEACVNGVCRETRKDEVREKLASLEDEQTLAWAEYKATYQARLTLEQEHASHVQDWLDLMDSLDVEQKREKPQSPPAIKYFHARPSKKQADPFISSDTVVAPAIARDASNSKSAGSSNGTLLEKMVQSGPKTKANKKRKS